MKTKLLIGMTTLALGSAFNANAISIGLDTLGTGTFSGADYVLSDAWTDVTDTATSVGTLGAGQIHTFTGQVRVGTMQLGSDIVSPLGLNRPTAEKHAFEITKQYSGQDKVKSVLGNPVTGSGTVEFEHTFNPGPNMAIYLDHYGTGYDFDGSAKAVAGSGGGTVSNYGDGVKILEATLIGNTSSFTSTVSGIGNGSFDLLYQFTYVDPLYITGLAVGDTERFTGTLTQPLGAIPVPAAMWDGTSATATSCVSPIGVPVPCTQPFKVDSSESFFGAPQVPEPSSVGLLGLGLLGLARRRKHKAS